VGKTILKREFLQNLYSLRFALSLVLVLGVFIAGSLSYVRNHAAASARYRESRTHMLDAMKADAESNATRLAVNRRTYDLRPRDNAFIADAKEKYLPNAVGFSAWGVFGFQNKSGSSNPFLARYDELGWVYIAGLILGFVALLFTFDAISGEKETKTLALTLSNPVSRGTLMIQKYVSAVLSVLAVLLPGVLVSLLILTVSGAVSWSLALALEILGFLSAAGLLTAAMAAFGLLCSVLARNSNVSLLLALSVWLLFAVVFPNSSAFAAKSFFPIEKSGVVQERINRAFDDLNKAAPPGSWSSNNSNPFTPEHELRASLQRKRLAAEKVIRDAYSRDMFRQLERARRLTSLSPVAAFEYLAEAIVGGGYPRFRKVWDDMPIYQVQFQNFFTAFDASDSKSPHWFNPNEDLSTTRLKVAFSLVPQFTERPMSFADRFRSALWYVVTIAVLACLAFLLGYVLFVRYDVR
jgi:ABC-type transport system involved in multi-copper enzyme maturation permease subunit